MSAKKTNNEPEEETASEPAKETELEAETPFVKSGFKKVKIKNFAAGSYKDAFFDADGFCGEISNDTLSLLSKQFPDAEIEEVA